MSEREPDSRVTTFLTRLEKLDAGDRARLKRDAGRALSEAQSLAVFYRLLIGLPVKQEETYFLIATLYPLADAGGSGNLGAALHRARDPKTHKGLDRRVEILLDADSTQLPFRLRQAIRFLKSNRIRVNWQQLLEDLLKWNSPYRTVQKEWARTYFALSTERSTGTESVSSDKNVEPKRKINIQREIPSC
jgi:CRISPR system Cascade subunit CasB